MVFKAVGIDRQHRGNPLQRERTHHRRLVPDLIYDQAKKDHGDRDRPQTSAKQGPYLIVGDFEGGAPMLSPR